MPERLSPPFSALRKPRKACVAAIEGQMCRTPRTSIAQVEVLRVPLCLTCYRLADLARFFGEDDRLRPGRFLSFFDAPADAGLCADEAGGSLGAVA